MTTKDKATPADAGPGLERSVGQPEPQRASQCGLTECRDKPMCDRCAAWERADAAPQPCNCPTRDALDAMLCDAFRRRGTVEQALYDMAAGKLPMPDAAKLRELAQHLGTPGSKLPNVRGNRPARGPQEQR